MQRENNPAHNGAPLADLELCFAWMRNIPERRLETVQVMLALGNAAAKRTAGLTATLHSQGIAPLIVCCGGRGRSTEQFQLPEARVMGAVLLLNRVPSSAVLREETSTNTLENLQRALAMLDEKGIARDRIMLVHDSGTPRRDRNLLWRHFPDYRPGTGRLTALHWSWGECFEDVALCGAFGPTIDAYAHMFVGTMQRVIEFANGEKSWHMPDEPPLEVLEAYQRLKQLFPQQLLTI